MAALRLPEFRLTRNMRNSQPIHEYAASFVGGLPGVRAWRPPRSGRGSGDRIRGIIAHALACGPLGAILLPAPASADQLRSRVK